MKLRKTHVKNILMQSHVFPNNSEQCQMDPMKLTQCFSLTGSYELLYIWRLYDFIIQLPILYQFRHKTIEIYAKNNNNIQDKSKHVRSLEWLSWVWMVDTVTGSLLLLVTKENDVMLGRQIGNDVAVAMVFGLRAQF